MKIYLAVPLRASRNLDFARLLHGAIRESGHETVSDYVVCDDYDQGLLPSQIFERDIAALLSSDCIIADISSPSTGVGMELGFAHINSKKILLLASKGSEPSRLPAGIPGASIIEYASEQEAAAKLKVALEN